MKSSPNSSWEPVEDWYDKIVGAQGHYYHQKIVLPGVLRLLELSATPQPKLLDLACGQGILSRHLPPQVSYVGIDSSPSLIRAAKQHLGETKASRVFFEGDVTQPLKQIKPATFTHAAVLLALQNIADPLALFKNLQNYLVRGGKCILVLNHPTFRIPRQSSWQIDETKKIQYRRIDRYFSSMQIPIQAHPSQKEKSAQTLTYHHPLSAYSAWLKEAGFMIALIEEWCSDKVSQGKMAKMENRSRQEFPLFLTLVIIKT